MDLYEKRKNENKELFKLGNFKNAGLNAGAILNINIYMNVNLFDFVDGGELIFLFSSSRNKTKNKNKQNEEIHVEKNISNFMRRYHESFLYFIN